MATPTSGAVPVGRSETRTRTALLLESIALRHQIAVLERSRTRRPCFRRIDRLLWILLSRWWPLWRESLVIVQPETVLRWRRTGWSALWGYRSRGHWRGGRPRISSEVRNLIVRMARENFLWGAPRIHGELLMLGFSVSQATVSRYLPSPGRRPTQSWRTFLRNQASAFGQYSEERSNGYARPHTPSYSADLTLSADEQIAAGQQQPTMNA
jgi:putative transposase